MGHSLGALANLSVILAIIIYIFAVVGMQLFGSSYTPDKFDGEIPRWRFTDFWHSFLLIFRIICGEWIEPLWDCMRAAGPASIILFIPAFILGHFIVSKQIYVSLSFWLIILNYTKEKMKFIPCQCNLDRKRNETKWIIYFPFNSSAFTSRLVTLLTILSHFRFWTFSWRFC